MGTSRFSPEFKEAIVKKLLTRGSQSIADFCKANGIAISTVTTWQSNYANVSTVRNKKNSSKYSAEEILSIIAETYSLKEEELGLYLRKNGLYPNQLSDWRANIVNLMNQPKANPNKNDERDLRIIELERDLKRKNSALAEASALLIVQKKVQEIWPMRSEDEDH